MVNENEIRKAHKYCANQSTAVDFTPIFESDDIIDCTVAAVELSIIRNNFSPNHDPDDELDNGDEGGLNIFYLFHRLSMYTHPMHVQV